MTRRYRVYPNGGRARAFDSFATAVTFAERAYQGQAAGDVRGVPVCAGSGRTFRELYRYGPFGWRAGSPRAETDPR